MPVTCGSLPDDALASILGGLSAQDAARAEATSKAFRRLRPRVVAAQRGHALRDAKVRLTVATDGHAYDRFARGVARVAEDVARPENNNARVAAHQPLDSQAKYR